MTRPSRFEHLVAAELGHRGHGPRHRLVPDDRSRALAQRLHGTHRELFTHLRRVAYAVPTACRPVAWLHHSRDAARASDRDLGLTREQLRALDLLAGIDPMPPAFAEPDRVRALAAARGAAANIARIVAHAALFDVYRFGDGQPERIRALLMLDDSRRELCCGH